MCSRHGLLVIEEGETDWASQTRKEHNESVVLDALSCLLIHRGAAYSSVYPADRLKCLPNTRRSTTIVMQRSAAVGEFSAPMGRKMQQETEKVCLVSV
jgi:hypothetical protein